MSRNDAEHRIYPYLLRNVAIVRPNQVWSSDITYVPMPHGWMYLTVVMDWYSRYVLSWRLSNTLDGLFCLEALEEALARGTPEIFNTDQGVQYTAAAFTGRLEVGGRGDQHGRSRPLDGQRVRGAFVADGEVRVTSTFTTTRRRVRWRRAWPVTSRSTTTSDCTRPWIISRRRRCTRRRPSNNPQSVV